MIMFFKYGYFFGRKKSVNPLFIILFFYLFISMMGRAQNIINEYSNFECSRSKLITIPFSTPDNIQNKKAPLAVNQTVFYEHRDQFSYWYKLVIKEDKLIDCKITAINSNDNYVLYIYKYAKNDFCNKVFYGKINSLKASYFLNNKDNKETFELSEVQFKAKKEEHYYICVLNTSPANCGHIINLIAGTDTINVKAIHYPCSDDDDVKEQTNKNQLQNNEVVITTPDKTNVLQVVELNVKEENNKNKKIDARIKIKEELTGNEIKIESTGQNSYKLEIAKGKSYMVECIATGYKKFAHSVVISEYVHPDSSNFDVLLRPLKAGDNFVMDNIYFYPNTYALKKESNKEITYLLNYLTNNPDIKIELQGHTNGNNKIGKNKAYKSMGAEWNYKGSSKKLSMYRAEAIKKYLITKGVDAKRISTKGFGGDKFIIENPKTLDAIQKNVRVEAMIF